VRVLRIGLASLLLLLGAWACVLSFGPWLPWSVIAAGIAFGSDAMLIAVDRLPRGWRTVLGVLVFLSGVLFLPFWYFGIPLVAAGLLMAFWHRKIPDRNPLSAV
jgi:hypothetical protein